MLPMLRKALRLTGFAAAMGVSFLSSSARAASDDTGAIAIADDEIFLDHHSGEFGSPLPYGKEFKVAIIVPAGSSATLTMKDVEGEVCPAQLASGKKYSGAPVGGPVGGLQKLTFKLPKLFPLASYCFQARTIQQRALSGREQGQFSSALVRAASTLVAQRFKGVPATNEQNAACKVLSAPAPTGNEIRACELAYETNKAAPAELSGLSIYSDTLRRPLTFQEALYQELIKAGGSDFLALAEDTVQRLANGRFAEQGYAVALGKATAYVASLNGKDPLYDPIPEVTASDFCPKLNAAQEPGTTIAKELCASGVKRATFVSGLFKYKTKLAAIDPNARTHPLLAASETALATFLGAAQEAQVIDVGAPLLGLQLAVLANQGLTAEKIAMLDVLVPKLRPLDNAAVLGWRDQAAPANLRGLQGLASSFEELQTDLKVIQEREQLEKSLQDGDAFKAFVEQFAVKRVYLGEDGMSRAESGTREDLFPFYASLDVGAAALGFGGGRWSFGQYFGVNFYFVPVDPSEPLYSGRGTASRGFARRFSVTLGTTTNGSSIEESRGIKGLVGSQMVLTGAGYRVLDFLRLSGGAFWFFKDSSNPLEDNPHLHAGGYMSLSLDLAAFTLISKGYTQLTTGKN